MRDRLSPLAAAFLEKVRAYRNVSLAELMRVCDEHGVDARGDVDVSVGLNVFVGFGLSEEFVAALDEIRPFTEASPCHVLVYLHDGVMWDVPLAKTPPKTGYRRPRWCPIVLNPKAPPMTMGAER